MEDFFPQAKHFFINDDRYRTFFTPCIDNAIDSKARFWIYFLQMKSFYCVSWSTNILVLLFYHISLIVAYPLNENKPKLLETFENWDRKVAKQLLNFLAFF